jgi:hypothetical protein
VVVGDARRQRAGDIDSDDVGSFAGQPNCVSSTHAARGAGDEGDPALETIAHPDPLFPIVARPVVS